MRSRRAEGGSQPLLYHVPRRCSGYSTKSGARSGVGSIRKSDGGLGGLGRGGVLKSGDVEGRRGRVTRVSGNILNAWAGPNSGTHNRRRERCSNMLSREAGLRSPSKRGCDGQRVKRSVFWPLAANARARGSHICLRKGLAAWGRGAAESEGGVE